MQGVNKKQPLECLKHGLKRKFVRIFLQLKVELLFPFSKITFFSFSVRFAVFVISPFKHFPFVSLSRMYSSLETPSNSSESHNAHLQYHSNAFNMLSTANKASGAATLAPKSNGSVKSIIRPSTDAHMKHSSTIFNSNNNNSNRNKFSYGACISTCSNNNFEDVKHNIRTTKFNEKM